MRTIFSIALFALFLVPGSSFAEWRVSPVSPEAAEELGIDVRIPAAGVDSVTVEIEFGLEDEFKDFSRVELRSGESNEDRIVAPLREVRTEEGQVVVSFSAAHGQLDTLSVWIMVPGRLGAVVYDVHVADFVE